MKKSVLDFLDMKARKERIAVVTAYDYPTARLAEKAGMDMILVGDSLGMVVYGYDGTIPVTMDEMLVHCRAVRRGAPETFIIGDMPFGSYQVTVESAVANAARFLKEAGMDCVKLEGGRRVARQVEAIASAGILVMGHIGLTPQSSGQLGGFKAQGRTAESAVELVRDALAIQGAGAFSILLEAVPQQVTEAVCERLAIPVLGIGAGGACDGQILINGDMLGLVEAYSPRFVKRYADVGTLVQGAFAEYVADVKCGRFPEERHTYRMKEGEPERFRTMLDSLT